MNKIKSLKSRRPVRQTAAASKTAIIIVIIIVIAFLLINPRVYTASVLAGFKLFANAVLPSLFPFLVLSGAVISLGSFDGASGFVGKAFKKLYNVPPVGGRIFLLGMICGYPVGAKLTADAYKNGELSKAGAKTVAALSSMSGPLFIISLVGASLLKNAAAAVIILISHYLSAVFCGLFFKNKTAASAAQNGGSMPPPRNLNHDSRQSGGRGDALAETVSSAITTILTVGGFIALFNMICDIALNSKILAPLSAALTLATKNESASTAVLLSFIEMTRGISDLCASKLPLPFLIPLISALVSFGGLSVTLQSLSFLKPAGVSLFTFLKIKSVQSLSAAFFASAFTLIFLFF